MKRYKLIAISCLLVFANTINASDVLLIPIGAEKMPIITLTGAIETGDAEKFKSQIININQAIVILNSSGGSVIDGLAIGGHIRSNKFFTAVPNNTMCVSACALIWLAGTQRFAEDSSLIGFHAAYIYKNGRPTETGVGNALIGSYLNRLGLSDSAVVFVTSAPPEGISRLDRQKAQQVGISYGSMSNYAATRALSETTASGNRSDGISTYSSYDPIKTVTKFYKALSAADGNTASALVIPKKQGIGPFNEKNIYSFYGSMQEPLSLQSIQRVDTDTVHVTYTYRATKTQCVGEALVTTEYMMGHALIKSIKANC